MGTSAQSVVAGGGAGYNTVAIAASIYFAIEGPVNQYVAIRAVGGGWRDVWRVHAVPLCLGAAAVGLAVGAAFLIPAPSTLYHWVRLGVIWVLSGGLYIAGLRWLAPDLWRTLVARLQSLRSRSSASVPVPSPSQGEG